MKTIHLEGTALLALLLLTSCTKQDAATGAVDPPHATVLLRDGTNVMGTAMTFRLDQPLSVVQRR